MAQRAGDGVDLDAAHRQPGSDGTLQQSLGLAALVAREPARAWLKWLWGISGLGHARAAPLRKISVS